MNKRFWAAIYVAPVALMSVYGRPYFGDVCSFVIIVVYLSLPFFAARFLKNRAKKTDPES
jgi:hypothetical protein